MMNSSQVPPGQTAKRIAIKVEQLDDWTTEMECFVQQVKSRLKDLGKQSGCKVAFPQEHPRELPEAHPIDMHSTRNASGEATTGKPPVTSNLDQLHPETSVGAEDPLARLQAIKRRLSERLQGF